MTPWPQRCPWCAELSISYVARRDRVECRHAWCGWHDKQPRRHRGIKDALESETCAASD